MRDCLGSGDQRDSIQGPCGRTGVGLCQDEPFSTFLMMVRSERGTQRVRGQPALRQVGAVGGIESAGTVSRTTLNGTRVGSVGQPGTRSVLDSTGPRTLRPNVSARRAR